MASSLDCIPAARSLTAVLGRHSLAHPDQFASIAAVALRGDELDTLADAVGVRPCDAGEQFRELAAHGFLGTHAALWLASPDTAFVGDWVRGRVYEIEFEVFTDPLTDAEWSAARLAVFAEWFEIRMNWAAEGHLTDPELAATLRAYTRVALSVLRLKPNEFRVGGKAIAELR